MKFTDSLQVNLGKRSYDILIGEGLLASAGEHIYAATGDGTCWIISDENVAPHYLDTVTRSLSEKDLKVAEIILPAGEEHKNFNTVEALVNAVLDGRPERNSTLLALGGGVVGDITGFAASQILRGINYIQIPTTLLAQVDSSVGGKTGVNTKHGKNLAGTFYQPRLVLADTTVLDTLPKRELLAGYAEVVKYGLIRDSNFFDWLEQNGEAVIAGDREARKHAVKTSCAAKAAIVAEDEFETGVRALLNFGHTFGHALEAETGFGASLLHGEAVAIGMIMALNLSVRMGLCPAENLYRATAHFMEIGLPVSVTNRKNQKWDASKLIEHMAHDKKVKDGKIRFILIRAIGDALVNHDANPLIVEEMLREAITK